MAILTRRKNFVGGSTKPCLAETSKVWQSQLKRQKFCLFPFQIKQQTSDAFPMQPRRPYPWHDFTINDWLAVDADDHVCFVESWREGGAPRWITIPTNYLANLRMRLENACGHSSTEHDTPNLTDKEIADSLGIYFLSSSDEGKTPIRYVYEAIPTVPCLVHDLPKTFSEIARHIRLPTKRLMNGDEIVCTDWRQGKATTLDTVDMANGVLVENSIQLAPSGFPLNSKIQNATSWVWCFYQTPDSRMKQPQRFRPL